MNVGWPVQSIDKDYHYLMAGFITAVTVNENGERVFWLGDIPFSRDQFADCND